MTNADSLLHAGVGLDDVVDSKVVADVDADGCRSSASAASAEPGRGVPMSAKRYSRQDLAHGDPTIHWVPGRNSRLAQRGWRVPLTTLHSNEAIAFLRGHDLAGRSGLPWC